jgi:hypothetical protein
MDDTIKELAMNYFHTTDISFGDSIKKHFKQTIIDIQYDHTANVSLVIHKSYLKKIHTNKITQFIKTQIERGVNIPIDLHGYLEAIRVLYDFFSKRVKVSRKEINELKKAFELSAKYLRMDDSIFRHAIQHLNFIQQKTLDDRDYLKTKVYFKDEFIERVEKHHDKYPLLLFKYVMSELDKVNPKGYKDKETKTSAELEQLIITVFDLRTREQMPIKKLRQANLTNADYLTDTTVKNAIQYYFQLKHDYPNHSTKPLITTIDNQ